MAAIETACSSVNCRGPPRAVAKAPLATLTSSSVGSSKFAMTRSTIASNRGAKRSKTFAAGGGEGDLGGSAIVGVWSSFDEPCRSGLVDGS